MNNWSLTIVLIGIYMVFSMVSFAVFGFDPESLQTQIHYSARTSFLIFAITFSAYPLFKIKEKKATKLLYRHRKYLGVSFALIHFYHLSLIIIKNYIFQPVFNQISIFSLLIGIIAYFFIGLMMITSFPSVLKRLPKKNWPQLHTTGGYVILTVFTIFYFRQTMQEMIYLPLFAIAVFVWLLRFNFKNFIRSQK